MGFIVNKTIESFTIDKIYEQLDIAPQMPTHPPQMVHFGGPVAPGQGFVLHSLDYREEETQIIGDEFALTASFDILRAKAKDEKFDGLLLSESALAKDWNTPEEDAAWASL